MTLKELFASKDLTAYQISKITGIGQTTLSSWTTGKINIDDVKFGHIKTLCAALDMTLDEFSNSIDQ